MKKLSVRMFQDESGFLTFEWILLITVLVIGITGALSAVRDALNWELTSVTGAVVSLDLSYVIKHPVMIKWKVGDFPDDTDKLYLSGTAVGSKYKYNIPRIAYRQRGGGTSPQIYGGGTGPENGLLEAKDSQPVLGVPHQHVDATGVMADIPTFL